MASPIARRLNATRDMFAPSQHELQPYHTRPEHVAAGNRASVRIFELLANGIQLDLDPLIDVPIDSECPRAQARFEQVRRPGGRQFGLSLERTTEPEPLEPGRELDAADASPKQRPARCDAIEF